MKVTFRMRGLVFAALVPALVVISVVAAWTVHTGIRQAILAGFDKKLFATSTVVGSFIDGDDHDRLMRGRRVTGLAFAADIGTLYGSTADGELVTLSTENSWSAFGAARDVGATGMAALGALAYDGDAGALYALDGDGMNLVRLDRRSGAGTVVGPTGLRCSGLTADGRGQLLAGGSDLVHLDAATGRGTRVVPLGGHLVSSLARGAGQDVLFGVDGLTGQLLRVDSTTGLCRTVERAAGAADSAAAPDSAQVLSGGVAFDPQSQTLYAASDEGLLVLDPDSGRVLRQGYRGYRDENGAVYRYYYERMRQVKDKCGLTFVYTYVLTDDDGGVSQARQRLAPERGRRIVYGLDAEELSDEALHSQTGSVDPDVASDEIRDVLLKGLVDLSDIEAWQEWGLLKSATAPVFDRHGVAHALAGADVNVDMIERKTRSALAKVCLVAVASLLLAGVVSAYIAGRLCRPISELKEGALRVAAGDYGHQIPAHGLRELGELTIAFNSISAALGERMEDVTRVNRALEARRYRRELATLLQEDGDGRGAVPDARVACARVEADGAPRDSSGWVGAHGICLVWSAAGSDDELEAARLHRDIALIAARVLERHSADRSALVRRLASLSREDVGFFGVLDARDGCAEFVVRQAVPLTLVGPGARVSSRQLTQDGCVQVPPGHVLVVAATASADQARLVTGALADLSGTELEAGRLLQALRRGAGPAQNGKGAASGGVLAVLAGPTAGAATGTHEKDRATANG